MAYCNLAQNMDWMESLVSYIIEKVINKCENELNILERDVKKLECVKSPFPRITYDEAVDILKNNGTDFKYGKDFGAADETIISNQYKSPVMIHSWPVDTKAALARASMEDRVAILQARLQTERLQTQSQ